MIYLPHICTCVHEITLQVVTLYDCTLLILWPCDIFGKFLKAPVPPSPVITFLQALGTISPSFFFTIDENCWTVRCVICHVKVVMYSNGSYSILLGIVNFGFNNQLKPKLTMLKDSPPGCQDTKGVFNSASCL